MKKERLILGRLGEDIAEIFLESKGYRIIKRNFRSRYSEIDLIARDRKKNLILVEVRTRTSQEFVSPEESINSDKLRRLVRSAKAYLAYIDYKGQARIDAVCIVFGQNNTLKRITHHENISQDLICFSSI
ncbi:MAG: YraN family protein [Candidatus Omnitrophica bacterium]|nr:YraN family protein [Candidatus Omnitrophota bacterium]